MRFKDLIAKALIRGFLLSKLGGFMLNALQRFKRWLERMTDCINIPKIGVINKKNLIAFFLLFVVSAAVASVAPVAAVEHQALPAPFNIQWIAVWVVSALAGVVTAFYKIETVDSRLYIPFIAKPIIGTVCGVVAVAAMIDDSSIPIPAPTVGHLPYAFFASLLGAIIIGGIMVYISDQKRFNKMMDTASTHVPFLNPKDGGSK